MGGKKSVKMEVTIILVIPDFEYIVVIPIHGNKDLGKGLELKIMKDLGLK